MLDLADVLSSMAYFAGNEIVARAMLAFIDTILSLIAPDRLHLLIQLLVLFLDMHGPLVF